MWLSSVTSIKSIDITSKTYQKTSKLKNLLKGYVDTLEKFDGTKYKQLQYKLEPFVMKTLEVAIPPVEMSAGQAKVFTEILDYAADKGIHLVTRIVE